MKTQTIYVSELQAEYITPYGPKGLFRAMPADCKGLELTFVNADGERVKLQALFNNPDKMETAPQERVDLPKAVTPEVVAETRKELGLTV